MDRGIASLQQKKSIFLLDWSIIVFGSVCSGYGSQLPAEFAANLGPFINTVEQRLDNHDMGIIALEQRA